jgi:hypothetical protein
MKPFTLILTLTAAGLTAATPVALLPRQGNAIAACELAVVSDQLACISGCRAAAAGKAACYTDW